MNTDRTMELGELFRVCTKILYELHHEPGCSCADDCACWKGDLRRAMNNWREISQKGGAVEFQRDADTGALKITSTIQVPPTISQKMQCGEVWYNTVVDAPFQVGTATTDNGRHLRNCQTGTWERWTCEDINGPGGVDEGVWIKQSH